MIKIFYQRGHHRPPTSAGEPTVWISAQVISQHSYCLRYHQKQVKQEQQQRQQNNNINKMKKITSVLSSESSRTRTVGRSSGWSLPTSVSTFTKPSKVQIIHHYHHHHPHVADDFPLASLPLLGYSVNTPSPSDEINKDYVFKVLANINKQTNKQGSTMSSRYLQTSSRRLNI